MMNSDGLCLYFTQSLDELIWLFISIHIILGESNLYQHLIHVILKVESITWTPTLILLRRQCSLLLYLILELHHLIHSVMLLLHSPRSHLPQLTLMLQHYLLTRSLYHHHLLRFLRHLEHRALAPLTRRVQSS